MFKPLTGVLNGATPCLFLERDNVLEGGKEVVKGVREYAGGTSSGLSLGEGYATQIQKICRCITERRRTYRRVKTFDSITWRLKRVKNHAQEECRGVQWK
jgi:hypothetical protein